MIDYFNFKEVYGVVFARKDQFQVLSDFFYANTVKLMRKDSGGKKLKIIQTPKDNPKIVGNTTLIIIDELKKIDGIDTNLDAHSLLWFLFSDLHNVNKNFIIVGDQNPWFMKFTGNKFAPIEEYGQENTHKLAPIGFVNNWNFTYYDDGTLLYPQGILDIQDELKIESFYNLASSGFKRHVESITKKDRIPSKVNNMMDFVDKYDAQYVKDESITLRSKP